MDTKTLASHLLAGIAAAACCGCVTQPVPSTAEQSVLPDTNVYFYPTRGQSSEQQDRDRYECNRWAVQQTGFDPSLPSTPPHLRTHLAAAPAPGSGVVIGAATGAFVGAAASPPWESGEGALLGALAGAVIGGVAESAAAEQSRALNAANEISAHRALLEGQSRDFRRALSACLDARGYTVQ